MISSLITFIITFSPEWLYLYSEYKLRRSIITTSTTTTFKFKFEKIGCMSCVHTIRNVGLNTFPGLVTNVIDVSNGMIEVQVPELNTKEFLSRYLTLVADAGFPATFLQ